ncbi:TPA: FMN-dependent L-lactate dehydrogenase LldD [Klebsiella pneumoniae]|uniref:FMN-dependent L-lactate dehydrogenase LldD n=1 Tax=Klebsiella pneumoniae complex TaxID=3390273 RepID=UPI001E552669|nr:FMN-dependent L-lactate dehydrogenase LldD [Klebsiella pneumoniae]HDU5412407.1 FMN-dependent L-lactate dehydrogenase LldD [Klebsiella pneumoniae subsp. pneumoniae]MCD9439357.1 FMN-dependent L-lactate dehydrogenase LldD [Klebsiella pneumoniae]MCP6319326.1 FMN-dependent L-lactate dehydrogenase LldD [Klebsiella pneumoniae]MDZ2556325.1 FMN-dependent L-lactate dehydrogenase LldD [Klebsiella pneumoniae]HCM5674486.1 FMN-dependent L-lactate dehydrogenase LldD [Klebsiella pneumoniae]
MIVSAPSDYREAARRRLPRFLFDYIDGGAVAENTMNANAAELASVALRQRVLCGAGEPTLATTILDDAWAMPMALGPVGATGMYARRGEVQAARAASRAGIPYTLSTVSVCSIEEVASHASGALWSQLYVLKDRGYMRNALERAWAAGMKTLVFTVDMPIPGSRYRDNRSGMSGPHATLRQYLQACTHPRWAMNVGLAGRPLSFGNIEAYTGHKMTMDDYMGFISNNFDPSIAWHDLEWIRDSWQGKLIIKGILDADDARNAVRLGADGIVVSNHGGRQLDGAIPTARALPRVVDAVGDDLTVLADSGVRSGVDVIRLLALGAKGVLLGRAYIYALAAAGEAGVAHLLRLFAEDMKVTMTLTGATSPSAISLDCLDRLEQDQHRTHAVPVSLPA